MSHNFISGFGPLSAANIYGDEKIQYINNTISLYDSNEVSPILFCDQKIINDYIELNFKEIINRYKR